MTSLRMTIALLVSGIFVSTSAFGQGVRPAPLSDIEIMLIKQKCLELEYDYAAGLDDEDPDLFANVFTPNAVMSARRGSFSGANDGMRKYLIGRNERKKAAGDYKTTHAIVNARIQVIDRDHARGSMWEIQYDYDPKKPQTISLEPVLMAKATTTYVRTRNGWKIATRDLKSIETPKEAAFRAQQRAREGNRR